MNKGHYSKRFLNRDGCHSDATISSYFYFTYSKSCHHNGSIDIRDCSSSIALSIGVLDEFDSNGNPNSDSFVNSVEKIDILIEELQRMKEILVIGRAEYKHRKKLNPDNA